VSDPTKCEACSKPLVFDHETGEWERACSCLLCDRCGVVYLPDDSNAPTIADTDALADEHDPDDLGACQPCWTWKLAPSGKWDRRACPDRIPGPGEGESFPCDLRAGHRGHHGSGSGSMRVHWNSGRKRVRS